MSFLSILQNRNRMTQQFHPQQLKSWYDDSKSINGSQPLTQESLLDTLRHQSGLEGIQIILGWTNRVDMDSKSVTISMQTCARLPYHQTVILKLHLLEKKRANLAMNAE